MKRKTIPTQVLKAADYFVSMYGQKLAYLGQYESKDAWQFCFPEDEELGFPVVYLYSDEKVDTINGFDALHIVNLLVKD